MIPTLQSYPIQKNLLALTVGIGFCLILFFSSEMVLRLLWEDRFLSGATYEDEYFYTDPWGINSPLPNGRYRSSLHSKTNGQTIYDVIYSIDSHSRRITPVENRELRTRHLLFFSCSFTL